MNLLADHFACLYQKLLIIGPFRLSFFLMNLLADLFALLYHLWACIKPFFLILRLALRINFLRRRNLMADLLPCLYQLRAYPGLDFLIFSLLRINCLRSLRSFLKSLGPRRILRYLRNLVTFLTARFHHGARFNHPNLRASKTALESLSLSFFLMNLLADHFACLYQKLLIIGPFRLSFFLMNLLADLFALLYHLWACIKPFFLILRLALRINFLRRRNLMADLLPCLYQLRAYPGLDFLIFSLPM